MMGRLSAMRVGSARILGQTRLWKQVLGLGLVMAAVQYGLAVNGIYSLAALGAGLAGILVGILFGREKQSAQPKNRLFLHL